MSWNPLHNAANEDAIEETKMAQSVQKVAYQARLNGLLLKFALVGTLVVFLFTYRPAQRTLPAEKEPSIKRDTIKHKRTPRCTWDPKDPCNERRNKK